MEKLSDEKKLNNFWKILAMLVIGILIGIFLGAKVISASADWPLNKTETCNLFNKTGQNCDIYWCNTIQDGNYSLSKEICVFNMNTNITVLNEINQTGIINETLIREIARNESIKYANESGFVNETLLVNTIIITRNSILDATDNITEEAVLKYSNKYDNNIVPTQPTPNWVWIALILGLCATAVAIFYIKSNKSKKTQDEQDYYRKSSVKPSYRSNKPYISPNFNKANKSNLHEKYGEEDFADTFVPEETNIEDKEDGRDLR